MMIQGRNITNENIELIRLLIEKNPSWHRTRLSKELCSIWDWKATNGCVKDMACRSLLRKLDSKELIRLPKSLRSSNNHLRNQCIQHAIHDNSKIEYNLNDIMPIRIANIRDGIDFALFRTFLSLYHYLGYSGSVGENLKYLVFERNERPVACLLFGAAAWQIADRDRFIGWNNGARKSNLSYIANNSRFLIFPWVSVPNLGSHILSYVSKRINTDWQENYNHPIYLLESFVDPNRFKGTVYKAANWRCVGKTKGRTRNGRYGGVPSLVKDVYLYPLTKNFSERLRIVNQETAVESK